MAHWTVDDIPHLGGRTAVVTGGNRGLGFQSVLELARKGARVVIACRSIGKGRAAVKRILSELPAAQLATVELDLADSESVERFAATVSSRMNRLDILMNNAAVVSLESLRRTPAGHEMHTATNHYGHFLVTGWLFPLLVRSNGARVVTLTSGAYRFGAIDFADLDWRKRPYSRTQSYGASKLANLLFMRELQKRFDAAGATALSLAAHPGMTDTKRQPRIGVGGALARVLSSSVEVGVLSQLRAATDPAAGKLDFFGPRFGIWGPVRRIPIRESPGRDAMAKRLWSVTEEITGFEYPGPPNHSPRAQRAMRVRGQ